MKLAIESNADEKFHEGCHRMQMQCKKFGLNGERFPITGYSLINLALHFQYFEVDPTKFAQEGLNVKPKRQLDLA